MKPKTCGLAGGLAGFVVALDGSIAHAQAFNVDFGVANPVPLETYGAASGQAGLWNKVIGINWPKGIFDLEGDATDVKIAPTLPFGPASFDHPGTTGNHEALFDDYLDLASTPATFSISGLDAGDYAVFSYAWAPDDPGFLTSITVNGSGSTIVGGEWPGGFEEGITHATNFVHLDEGENIDISVFGFGNGTFNGLQIVPIPAPAAASLVLAFCLPRGRRYGAVAS